MIGALVAGVTRVVVEETVDAAVDGMRRQRMAESDRKRNEGYSDWGIPAEFKSNSVKSKTPMSPETFNVDCSCECDNFFWAWAFVPCCSVGQLYDEKIEPCHGEKMKQSGNSRALVLIASLFANGFFIMGTSAVVNSLVTSGLEQQVVMAQIIFVISQIIIAIALFARSYFLFRDIYATPRADSHEKVSFCNAAFGSCSSFFCCVCCNFCWVAKLVKHADKHGGSRDDCVGAPIGAYPYGIGANGAYGTVPQMAPISQYGEMPQPQPYGSMPQQPMPYGAMPQQPMPYSAMPQQPGMPAPVPTSV